MTYDEIDLRAANKARMHFRSLLLSGCDLDRAYVEREYVYRMERKSQCTKCGCWKHVDEFHKKTGTTIQSWCAPCQIAYHRNLSSPVDRAKWRAGREKR